MRDGVVHREGRSRPSWQTPPATNGKGRELVVTPIPREPRVMSLRRLDFQLDETEEDTFIRPETMVRRALIAIDPGYADRTAYDGPEERATRARGEGEESSEIEVDRDVGDDGEGVDAEGVVGESVDGEGVDTQAQTQRRRRKPSPSRDGAAPRGSLPALRVAVLPIPEDGDVRLLFLPPGAEPPPGVAVALLVPPTERDAELLAEVYADCNAKL
jgi:hypothetical protein